VNGAPEPLLIVGGGLAGAAAALRLAEAGLAPLLLERERGPAHKVCGEFLSWEAQAHLRALGLDVRDHGAAPISQLRVANGSRVAEAPLPFEAAGLTRFALDAALLSQAEAAGARVRRGAAVRAISPDGGGLRLDLSGGETIEADRVLLASGKYDVPGARRPPPGRADDLLGFKTYLALDGAQARALSGHIEVALFDGGYAGLQPVEGGLANLCLLVRRRQFDEAGRAWPGLRALLERDVPHLGRRLAGAAERLPRPLATARPRSGFVHRDNADDPPGLFRLGDQAGTVAPLAGDGMAMALHGAALAAAAILGREDARTFHRRLLADIRRPIRYSAALETIGSSALGRRTAVRVGALWPGVLAAAARRTRVPKPALARLGLVPILP
jgi:flavin-dependent dehydrogenase